MVSLLPVPWSAPVDLKKRGPGNEAGLSRLSIDVTLKHTHISVLPGFSIDVQELFKSLKKEAECPLCLDTVENPKTLPCLHSFCQECLDKLTNVARRQLQTSINCPLCQTSFPIPYTDTFANLPSSFHLNRLVDVLVLEYDSVQA